MRNSFGCLTNLFALDATVVKVAADVLDIFSSIYTQLEDYWGDCAIVV